MNRKVDYDFLRDRGLSDSKTVNVISSIKEYDLGVYTGDSKYFIEMCNDKVKCTDCETCVFTHL